MSPAQARLAANTAQGFCGATFIIGSGLGTLETAANPYLAVCGPPQYSEMRLNFAQAVQAVGTVVGPVLASQVFFKNVSENESSLLSVQWVYLGIAIFVFVLAGVFYISTIPEITDADMERQMETAGGVFSAGETKVKPLKDHYQLWWGSFSQFCYVGAQGTCSAAGRSGHISRRLTAHSRHRELLCQLCRRGAQRDV